MSNSIKKLLLNLALLASSAVLLSCCFPGMGDIGALVFAWGIPFFYVLFSLSENRLFWKGFACGYFCGLVFWLLNLKWLLYMAELSFVPLLGALFAWFILPAYLAFYFGIFGALIAKWGNPWKAPRPKEFKTRIDEKIAQKLEEKKSDNKFILSVQESILSLRFAFMHASLWTVLEWVRSVMITGFGWNGLGVGFYDIPVLAQSAELVGVIGLSFAPMFVLSILFQVVARMIQEAKQGKMKPHFDLAVAGLLIAAMFGFGVSRLYSLTAAKTKDVGFLIVQQNIPLDLKHGESSHIGNIMTYVQMSEEGLEEVEKRNEQKFKEGQKNANGETIDFDKVDFVVWPESSLLQGVNTDKETGANYYSEVEGTAITETLALGNFTLITGCNDYVFPNEHAVMNELPSESYNSIALFKETPGEKSLVGMYKKNHLVIFGEYIPMRETFPILEKIVGASHGSSMGPNYLPGNNTEPLVVQHEGRDLHLIGAVCFEDTVGRLTRKSMRNAEQIIVNSTNDGWFGDSSVPKQHFANAVFRTIELRRPMVRSANTGISCVINVKGSIEGDNGQVNAILDENGHHFTEGTLFANAKVLVNPPITLYALAGDWFVVLCAVIFLYTFVSTLRKRLA